MSMKGLLPILSLRFQLSEMGDAVREVLGATTPADWRAAQARGSERDGHAGKSDPSARTRRSPTCATVSDSSSGFWRG